MSIHVSTHTQVQYGELVVPSDAEVVVETLAIESRRAAHIGIEPSSLATDITKLPGT